MTRLVAAAARRSLLGVVLVLAAFPAHAGRPKSPPPAPVHAAGPEEVDLAQVAALAGRLREVLAGNSSGSVQQIEGRLQLAIANAQSRCSVTKAAIAQLLTEFEHGDARIRAALRDVGATADQCAQGPGAAPGAPQFLQQGTTLGLPGGSSNYLGAGQ